jgi:hypothetical protein
MNGITEPLPGLLDDPQFQFADLPALVDFQIAPLRNPAPSRHANIPLPLEPVAGNIINGAARSAKNASHHEVNGEKKRTPQITPNDVLLAREAKKPHLAISELLEAEDGADAYPGQLPSFVSLAVVEKSPVQVPSSLQHGPPEKRLRLDMDGASIGLDMIRHLPRPPQKDGRLNRPAPLLPAMVTGLHEPPPSAALLPSIEVEARPVVARTNTTSKIHVRDMLTENDQDSTPQTAIVAVVPETTTIPPTDNSKDSQTAKQDASPKSSERSPPIMPGWKDNKPRRVRRKWTVEETNDLLAGVKKYGIGKWKQILDDPASNFSERSSVDLKDRYRVCANHDANSRSEAQTSTPVPDHASPIEGTNSANDETSPSKAAAAESPSEQNSGAKPRRKRRAWTTTEDENLLKGVGRHGFQWTAIHDDPELELSHRRATDLRDRIRNKFPDGYKHAETAPLRSEVKKAEKLAVTSAAGQEQVSVTGAVPAGMPPFSTMNGDSGPASHNTPSSIRSVAVTVSSATPSKIKTSTSATSLTMLLHSEDREIDSYRKDKDQPQPIVGVTLPSFNLGMDDDMNWDDNRLPPVHEWEEIGL